jgi:hypothetical protein
MKFFYTALTTDNKKITGVLDTPDRDFAQAELHKMGVAILSVNEISDADYEKFQAEQEEMKTKKGIRTFQFLAIDNFGKEIEGTIDALDDFSAYKRLREEYQFKIDNLFLVDASEEDKVHTKALIPGFEDQLKQIQVQTHKGEKRTALQQEKAESDEDVDKEIIAEIDRVIINTKKTLENHANLFSTDLLIEVQNTLGELERVRTSNNIKHITEISNDLYALISSPDKAEAGMTKDESYQALLSEIHDSALVRKDFELYKKAVEASGLRHIFSDIAKRIKEATEPKKDEEGKPVGFVSKFKLSIHNALERMTKRKPLKLAQVRKMEKPKSKVGDLMEKLGGYFKASSPILKKTRQREFMNALKGLFRKRPVEAGAAEAPLAEKEATPKRPKSETSSKAASSTKRARRDFTSFFVEIDSFIGWLLCFYILYYFLVDFSLEKGIGLPREFVFKTLKTPLLLNITLFLLLMHTTLRFRNLHLRGNAFATLFLLFVTLGAYLLLVVNF